VVDGSGNVYVTGSSQGSGTGLDYATIKYDKDGNLSTTWPDNDGSGPNDRGLRRYNGPGNGDDEAYSLAVDSSGNVYVTGHSDGDSSGAVNFDYATIKYNSSGDQVWVARYNGPGNGDDQARALVLDVNRDVYVTGFASHSSQGYNDATVRYDPDGTPSDDWPDSGLGNGVRHYHNSGEDRAVAIAIDSQNAILVTGKSVSSGADFDYATVKYSTSGGQDWVARKHSGDTDDARDVTVDGSRNVYVTGALGSSTAFVAGTIKYKFDGTEIWTRTYAAPENQVRGHAVAVNKPGTYVYISGQGEGCI
jgi:hypothetical protein